MTEMLHLGRVATLAAALGVGAAVFGSTAVAAADTGGTRTTASGARDSASTHGSRGAAAVSSPAPAAAVRTRVGSAASSRSALAPTSVSTPPAPAAVSTPPPPAVKTLTLPAPAATLPAAAAVTPTPTYSPAPPNPDATISTSYGTLGQWMINKSGQVADWVGVPYCGKGSTSANCKPDTPGAKTIQEPINTVFVVKAPTEGLANMRLWFALTVGGFGPSPFSSVGYKAIVGSDTDSQYPRGMPLFGLLAGIGPAYRDAPFFLANTHLRTFGGTADGKGNYVFTASVSKENLDASGTGLLPTHGFDSFTVAQTTLVDQMVKRSWITGASNMGMVAMDNAISPDDPKYTTGDATGLAVVLGIGTMLASAPSQSISPASSTRPAKTVTAA